MRSWRGRLPFESLYTAGLAGQAFLEALRSKGQIMGTRCAPCDFTYVPARHYCERCFAELREYTPVGSEGRVVSVTILHEDLDGNRLAEAQPVAAVQLDGASTVLIHRLLKRVPIGSRVKVVLRRQRVGSILDIKGFTPV